MHRKTIILLFAAIIVSIQTGGVLYAQNYVAPEVEVSKEKIKIDGQIFLSHIVKEKQTLYSISKAYNVSIDEIYKYNKGLREEGLKKNSILLIPFKELKELKEVKEEKVIKLEEALKEKQIESKETKEQTKEEVSPNEQKKEEKKTEKKSRRSKSKKNKDNEGPNIHIVKWYEDIKSIATKYDVSIEAIMQANGLESEKIRTRQKLIIPDDEIVTPIKKISEENNKISQKEGTQEIKKEKKKDRKNIFFFPKTSVNINALLPLQAKEGKSSRNFMDFYSGCLMAVKHLKETGINTNFSIFDTSNESIVKLGNELRNTDIILGPVAPEQLDSLYIVCGVNVPVISPLDPKTESIAQERKRFVYAPTSHEKQYIDLCKWVSEDYSEGERITVIFEKNGYKTNYHPTVLNQLQIQNLPYREFSYSILEGREIKESLKSIMTQDKTNRVIIASESEAFVNDIVRNINLLTLEKKDIVLYATGKIRSFETIAPADLHKNKLHSSMAYNIDYESIEVMNFLKEYRALFNAEPSQFAFQGYDLTRYAVEMFSKHGAEWLDYATEDKIKLLQSSYQFEKINNNGFVNTATRRVVYEDDYKVTIQ